MTLSDLIGPLDVVELTGDLHCPVTGVTDDSRSVKPGHLFVAVKGERVDGHKFLAQAVSAGASAVIVEGPAASGVVPTVRVRDSRRALGIVASRFHRDPSSALTMIGVTGTNGKTTTTYLCKALLEHAGRRVGLIGTVAYQVGNETIPAAHTTPGAVELQSLLRHMLDAGMDTVVMEASSHALALDRVVGCEFDTGVFTNLTQDHLDFHRDMDEYFRAKLRLFTGLSSGGAKHRPKRAVLNADDPRSRDIAAATKAPVWTYGIRAESDVRALDVRLSLAGTTFTALTPAGRFPVESRLVGEHNVSNVLAAIGVALQEGLAPEQIRAGVASVANVPGRFERVEAGQDFTVVVDYAHTDDALIRLLTAAQTLKTGRIITVFGCGGDRDRGKRPKMGRAAARLSDLVILTSDNPRTEDPQAILKEVEVGVREVLGPEDARYEVIADRAQAIETAVREARTGDTVVIAGKGHEDYQIIGTTKFPFDDRVVARDAIRKHRQAVLR
jgi:UDP-N-acetylmuramoyl-L-alanyl-D-glutamate--2,6-diaminopimelate ligase